MRLRSFASFVLAVALGPSVLSAQATEQMREGDYLRFGAGPMSPVSPSGSLRNWDRGNGFSFAWENWQQMENGSARAGFGIAADYATLPLNEQEFISRFQTDQGTHPSSATAKKATVWTIATDLRLRIPAPLVVPTIQFGFGIIDYRPSTINYVAGGAPGSAPQQTRTGAEISVGGGLDRDIADRFALYAEALWRYGFTSVGEGIAAPGTACVANSCDALKNTSFGTIRGGLRVRVGR